MRLDRICPSFAFLLLGTLLAAPPARAQEPLPSAEGPDSRGAARPPETYLRVREEEDGSVVLDLAARSFVSRDGSGPRIHLFSAVHIADASFYERMQELLDQHELVLFEGVKPPGAGDFDAMASTAEKIKAVEGRLGFLVALAQQVREKEGRFPGTLEELVDGSGKRWRNVARALLRDAWGQPIRYELRPPGEGDAESVEQVVLSSNGPDGEPDASAGGDDIRVEASALGPGVGKRGRGANIQQQLASALGLTFQLDAMNSGKDHWRNSDMSVDELQARLKAEGGSAAALLGMLDGSSFLSKLAGVFLGFIGQSPELSAMLKVVMVDVLGSSDAMFEGGGGRTPKSMQALMKVILKERNVIVIRDLAAILERKEPVKDIAVFYGAGHMVDLERRLTSELGYVAEKTTWTAAIRANPEDAGMSADAARRMRGMVKRMVDRQLDR